MASLDMKGPYDFEAKTIDAQITKTSPGNYALGHLDKDGDFIPKYVGRADDDLNGRLKAHVGEKYKKFKYSYADSEKVAFEKECVNYHDFEKQLDNKIHPDRPEGKEYKCPKCRNFDK